MFRHSYNLLRYVLLIATCLSLVACLTIPTPVVQGVLHGDLIWQGEVLVAGDVILERDVKLTILPGTRVRFMAADAALGGLAEHPYFPGSELVIKGQVHAVGTPSDPIRFESVDPAAPAGSWGALNLEGSQKAVFEYCIFRQADSAVHSRESQVNIQQSLFEDNLVAVRFNNSQILVEHNLLRNNHTGIRFHFGSPVIYENEFIDNNVNIFVTSSPSDYRIENNSFGLPVEYHVVLGENVPDDVSMPHNFWAYPEASLSVQTFYDSRRSPYLGRTLIEPRRTAPSSQVGLSWSP